MISGSSSAAISPAKDVVVAINVHREAEIYSLNSRSYIRKVEISAGPFWPVKSVIFYDYNSLALAYAEEVGFKIIPDLDDLHSYNLLLARSKGRHFPPASSRKLLAFQFFVLQTHCFDSHRIRGQFFFGCLNSRKILIFPNPRIPHSCVERGRFLLENRGMVGLLPI